MSGAPLISVVMSVYNDEKHVAAALDSILSQEDADLEFIVIDDGSTDETGEILDAYAGRDPRLRVVHQENAGLTRALIRGCNEAKGKYVARQDGGGDRSFTGRLIKQVEILESHPEVVMTSCGTRFIGPRRELLFESIQSEEELQRSLDDLNPSQRRGPTCHPSTMFRRSSYNEVGGYRPVFAVAQDQDLWLRLAEVGRCLAMPEVLYEARLSPGSISANRRREQAKSMKVILNCARQRRSGLPDIAVIEKFATKLTCAKYGGRIIQAQQDARFYYFIGCLLRKRKPEDAKAYFRKALRAWLFNPKAIVRLCLLGIMSEAAGKHTSTFPS